jgi:adenosylhomocysteine nucleosidase
VPKSVDPRILILAPLAEERELLTAVFGRSHPIEAVDGLRIPCGFVHPWRMLLAPGGHGKTHFATQTQYLIDRFPSVELVICADAAGALDPALSPGDVVVGTATVEHDYRLLFATRPLPRFAGDASAIDGLRRAAREAIGFNVVFGVIASSDEDVVSRERSAAIRAQTGAVCVAWEGSGAARAAAFNGIGSVELRAVTDAADKEAPQDFAAQLPVAMHNLAVLLRAFLETTR